MRNTFKSVTSWLRHPALTFASNVQFVIGAAIFIAGLVGGALAVLTSFPTVWLVMAAAGAFLATTGAIGTFIPAVREQRQPRTQSNPYSEAAALKQEHDKRQQAQAEQQEEIKLRRASRLIRGELLDNKEVVERLLAGESARLVDEFATAAWRDQSDVLLEHGDRDPYEHASEAHRQLSVIWRTQYTRSGGAWQRRPGADRPLDTEMQIALEAIDQATETLGGV